MGRGGNGWGGSRTGGQCPGLGIRHLGTHEHASAPLRPPAHPTTGEPLSSPLPAQVQQLQQVPVQHVYPNQVQYVEGGDASYTASTM